MPGYLANQKALSGVGVDDVIVYCVNDAAVMQAWAKDQKAGLSMVQLMADPHGDLTRALGMELTADGPRLDKGLVGRIPAGGLPTE